MNVLLQKRRAIRFAGLMVLLFIAGFSDHPRVTIAGESLQWLELEQAQKAAAIDGKTVMVFVEAEWCGFCRRMEQEVFPDKEVKGIIENEYLPVTIDLDSRERIIYNGEEMTEREFARKMNVRATPTFIFLNPLGSELGRIEGYNPADRFIAVLEFVQSDQFGKISLEEYMHGRQ